jgi:hypothetical protein
MKNEEKMVLIEEIKKLIATEKETIDINPNYLEYFELEELQNIKDELILKKKNIEESTSLYVEEIYTKLI